MKYKEEAFLYHRLVLIIIENCFIPKAINLNLQDVSIFFSHIKIVHKSCNLFEKFFSTNDFVSNKAALNFVLIINESKYYRAIYINTLFFFAFF